MTSRDDDVDPARPQRLSELTARVASELNEAQRRRAHEAQELGYASVSLQRMSRQLVGAPDDPSYAQSERVLKLLQSLVAAHERNWEGYVGVAAAATIVTSSSTATAIVTMAPVESLNGWVRPNADAHRFGEWGKTRIDAYAEKLDQLSAGLGKKLRGVWENLHSGSIESPRGALVVMRELVSQFIESIAPDDQVRSSEHFSPKAGANPNLVHRRERIRYAAHTKVRDPEQRELLLAEMDLLLDNYNKLNRLHAREDLETLATHDVLMAVQGFLEHWIDAVWMSREDPS